MTDEALAKSYTVDYCVEHTREQLNNPKSELNKELRAQCPSKASSLIQSLINRTVGSLLFPDFVLNGRSSDTQVLSWASFEMGYSRDALRKTLSDMRTQSPEEITASVNFMAVAVYLCNHISRGYSVWTFPFHMFHKPAKKTGSEHAGFALAERTRQLYMMENNIHSSLWDENTMWEDVYKFFGQEMKGHIENTSGNDPNELFLEPLCWEYSNATRHIRRWNQNRDPAYVTGSVWDQVSKRLDQVEARISMEGDSLLSKAEDPATFDETHQEETPLIAVPDQKVNYDTIHLRSEIKFQAMMMRERFEHDVRMLYHTLNHENHPYVGPEVLVGIMIDEFMPFVDVENILGLFCFSSNGPSQKGL